MKTILQDWRYAARMLVKAPGFTATAIITLALGIGANTAIFSVINAVLLRPLPFPQPDQLVLLRDDLAGRQLRDISMSVPELEDLRQRSNVFQEVAAVWPADANLTGSDRPERIELLGVSPNYFSLLGVDAQLGRVFGPQDKALGFAEGVVISDGLWKRLFGADQKILGRNVRVDNDLYVIIGVMPPGFRHPGQTLRNAVDIWATAGFSANPFPTPVLRSQRILPGAIGRIKPGLTVAQAQAQLDTFVGHLEQEYPNDYPPDAGWKVQLLPAQENLVGSARATLMVLLAAVGCVLLIGCVNIANLLLARSSARHREMAVRLALGASRKRLVWQLLNESLMLALIGGGLSLALLAAGMKVLLRLVPANIPRMNEAGVDGRMLVFAFLLSLVTGVLFGLVPALQASRTDLLSSLKDGSKGAGSSAKQDRFRGALVVAEFALSLVLMIGAGLLLRSFWQLLDVNPGFDPNHVLVSRIWLPVPNNPALDPYRPFPKRIAFEREILRRVRELPGVQYVAVGAGNGVPLIGPHTTSNFTIEEQADDAHNLIAAQTTGVSPDYFRALGTPLIRGRFFAENDDDKARPVAMIDETMAQRFWPNEDPVGKRIKFGPRNSASAWRTIVGIAGNIKSDGFDQPEQPHLYFPILQNPSYSLAVYVRTENDPATLLLAVRQQVQAVDHDLPVFGEQSMEQLVASSLEQRRFAMQLVGLFGIVALLLAGVGIYGVMSYSVTQRTNEIGIRIAIGAQPVDVLRLVVGQGLQLAAIGVVVGLTAAFALTRLMSSLLFGVSSADPLTFAAISILLSCVALTACLIPARRATRVDPMVALRCE